MKQKARLVRAWNLPAKAGRGCQRQGAKVAKYKVSRDELEDLREMIEHDELPDSGNINRIISRYGVMSEWD